MKYRLLLTICLLVGLTATGIAQTNGTLEGTVTDSRTGEPLPGVNIVIQGTQTGTTTGADGTFSLAINEPGETLIFSFIGYNSELVTVSADHLTEGLNVQLVEDVALLDEMIVVGFGTERRDDITGAVSSISTRDIERRTTTNTALALQGMSPGVTIQDQGGQPGEESVVANVRGIGTLNNANPLVLIDGVEQSLGTVEPRNIASVTVLKDAASAAIYGSRAANGVILITTKRGAETGITVNYNNHIGVQNPRFFPEGASTEDWMMLVNEAQVNAGGSPIYSQEYMDNVLAGTNPLEFPFADFEGGIFHRNAIEHDHNLSVSTGSETGRLYAAVNYTDTDGIMQNFHNQRASIRLNTDLFVSDDLTLKSNLLYRNREVSGPGFTAQRIVQGLLHMNRDMIMRYPDGQTGTGDLLFGQWNPYIMANSGETTRSSNDIVGTFGFDYQINDILSIEGDFTANIVSTDERVFRETRSGIMTHPLTGETVAASGWFGTNTLQEGDFLERELSQRLFVNLQETIASHNITAVAGYEEINNRVKQTSAGRANFFNNELRNMSAGDSGNQMTCSSFNDPGEFTGSCFDNEWRLRSFFGRVNYIYDDRYSFQANLRYDGSSRFAEGRRWGLFPSFSAGWRISSEDFMQGLPDWVSNVRFRGSWGQLGNERIGLFQFMNMYNLNLSYQFNEGVVPAAGVTDAGNPGITWETTTSRNVGVDLGFMDDRLEIVGEYFWNLTSDILLQLPSPPSTGVSPPTQNAAEVSNVGWEVAVNYRSTPRIETGFQYSIGISISDAVNTIESLRGEGPFYPDKFTVWEEGYSINALRGFRSPGLYRTQEDLDQYPAKWNPQVGIGDIIYEDLTGDGSLSQSLYPDGDQYVMGNEDPRYEFGINFSAAYRGFDFSMFWQGVLQQEHSLDGALMEGPNWQNFIPAEMARETFHPERNPEGTWPLVTAGNTWNLVEADFWLQDTKYARLKSVQLGYQVPQTYVRELRVFVSGENLLTFTPTELFDPETPRGRSQFFPHRKMVSMGINITF